jgi:phage protein D
MPAGKYLTPDFKVELDGSALTVDLSRNITDVSVTLQPDTMDQCSLTLANPYPELPWTHGEHADLFKEGAGLKVSMGYVGELEVMFDGEVASIGVSFPESGTSTLKITGRSKLHRLKRSTNTRTFLGKTDSQIVSEVVSASGTGMSAQADATTGVREYVIQNNLSDLDFIHELAKRNRYEVYGVGSTLYFAKPRDAKPKAYTMVWGRTAKTFEGELVPLRSFTPNLDSQSQVSEVVVRGRDLNKKTIEGTAGKGKEDSTMEGSVTGPEAANKAFGTATPLTVTDQPVATKEEADALAKALYNKTAQRFITGNGASIGLPKLRAGVVVEIEGVGPRFSGAYYVTSSVHSLGSGGYSTSFTVRRNAEG